MVWGSISIFRGFLEKENPLDTLIVIFENVSPKGFSWLKMKYFEISVLTANSPCLQTGALKCPGDPFLNFLDPPLACIRVLVDASKREGQLWLPFSSSLIIPVKSNVPRINKRTCWQTPFVNLAFISLCWTHCLLPIWTISSRLITTYGWCLKA